MMDSICDFCRDPQHEPLIAGSAGKVHICAHCVPICRDLLEEYKNNPPKKGMTMQHKQLADNLNQFAMACNHASNAAGWWSGADLNDPQTVATKLCLIHSEISEAMEGHRKGLMDDKLPHRSMIEVELADAMIRIGDLAKQLGLDIGGAAVEKMAYNSVRPDHKPEARSAAGGKAY